MHGGLGQVCVTRMYRSIGHVEFPKFQTGMFVEWKAPQMYRNLLFLIFSDSHYSTPSCDHFGRYGG